MSIRNGHGKPGSDGLFRLPLRRMAAALVVWGACAGCPALAADGPPPPNVLMIVVDDLNDWVGCLEGHPGAKTPHIDALARRGTLFTNAHCQAPICGPSRASFFTGLRPTTSGIYLQIDDHHINSASAAARRSVALPDYFERYGYRTLGVGKLYHKGDRAKRFDEYGGGFARYGPKPKERMNYDPAWYDRPGRTQYDWGPYPDDPAKMPDYQATQWAIEKLREQHDQPFFLAVGLVRPHVPHHVPQRWFDEHPLESVETPPYRADDLEDVPAMGRRVADAPHMPTAEGLQQRDEWKEAVQAYLACCTWSDHCVGQIVAALDESPHAGNTIILLWSDHGFHLGEKNRFSKQSLWERSTRVPLILAGPRIGTAARVNQPVELVDLYPTLLELCGLAENRDNEGHSLVPLLQDPQAEWPHMAITTYGPVNFAVRSERYRYQRYEDGSEEFYDMRRDPNEWTNLAGEPALQEELERHRQQLPAAVAPLAEKSYYNFNRYFRERVEKWKRGELEGEGER